MPSCTAITTAKRAETRARRIEQFVAMLARGETPYPQKRGQGQPSDRPCCSRFSLSLRSLLAVPQGVQAAVDERLENALVPGVEEVGMP